MSHLLPPSKALGLGACPVAPVARNPTSAKKTVSPVIIILYLRILICFSFVS
jgi:hypothetical protein